MTTSRETIYQALFALVTPLRAAGAIDGPPDGKIGATGVTAIPGTPTSDRPFNLVSRDVIPVQQVPPGLQPVLFMDEATEDFGDSGPGLIPKTLTVWFHLGCVTQRGTAAATILNPLIDRLEAVLGPTDGNSLGVGDVLQKAQLSGTAVKNFGNNTVKPEFNQAVIYVPFEISWG